ncbi:MAG: neuraminidase-like domain-containing protein, partial [Bacteroidota bacterium]
FFQFTLDETNIGSSGDLANNTSKVQLIVGETDSTIVTNLPSAETLDRLQRFIRLVQKTGWAYADLDWALNTLGATDIDKTAIIDLAKVQHIMDQFSIPVDEATALFGDMKTYGQGNGSVSQTLFDRVFNQPNNFNGATAPYQPTFSGNPFFESTLITWDYAANLQENSSDPAKIRSSLLAALQITETDLAVLLKYLEVNGFDLITDDGIDLTVGHLSLLYRYTQLPKLLKITIPQFCALLPFLPTNTLDTIDNLRAVIQHIQTAQQSLLSIGQLIYLLDAEVVLPKEIQLKLDRQQQMMLNQLQQSATNALLSPKSFITPNITEKEAIELYEALVLERYINEKGVVLDERPLVHKVLQAKLVTLLKGKQPTSVSAAPIAAAIPTTAAATHTEKNNGAAAYLADLPTITEEVILVLNRYKNHQDLLVINALASFYKLPTALTKVGMLLTKQQLAGYARYEGTSLDNINEVFVEKVSAKGYNPRLLLVAKADRNPHQESMTEFLEKLPRNLSWLQWNQLTALEGFLIAQKPQPLGIASMGYGYEPTFLDLMAISLYKQQCVDFQVSGLEYLSYLGQKTNVDAFIFTKKTNLYYQNNQQNATNNGVTVATETIGGLPETVFTFDGTSTYFEIENTEEPIIPTAFSFSCSFLLSSAGGSGSYSTIFSSRHNASGNEHGILLRYHHDSQKLRIWTNASDLSDYVYNQIDYEIALNKWYDFVLTIDGGNCAYRLIDKATNQVLKAETITLTGSYTPNGISKFRLGSDISNNSETAAHFWDGKIANPLFSEYATNTAVAKKRQTLANIAQWDIDQLNFLMDAFIKKGSHSDFNTIQGVQTLINCFDISQTMGIDTALVWHLRSLSPQIVGTDGTNWTNYTDVATEYQNAFVLHYGEEAYEAAIAPLRGQIEERSRDFLSQLLIWELGDTFPDIQTQDQLYEFLLLDVEMTSTVNISPLKLGLNSLQLYVQRCMMNLERGVNCTIPKQWWAWMSEYRTWQVNREIYLYPENYLDPTLRKLQSPLFNDLVSNVQQAPISKDSVTSAYTDYLNGLKDLSNLLIVDSCVQEITPINTNNESLTNPQKVIALFGKTTSAPATYYYRMGSIPTTSDSLQVTEKDIPWTPWEQ